MKVKYERGPAAVDIDAVGQRVKRGEPVEVSKEIGEQLVRQGWTEVKAPVSPPTPITPTTVADEAPTTSKEE